MRSDKEFWLNLLIDAGLTHISGQEFNMTGDSFLVGLEAATTPEEIAGVLAFHLPAPCPVPAPLIGLQPLVLFDFTYFNATDDYRIDELADKIRRFNKRLTEE